MIPQEIKNAAVEAFKKSLQEQLRPAISKAAEMISSGDLNAIAVLYLIKANDWVENLYAEPTSDKSSSKTNE